MTTHKIYVASSWHNKQQPDIVKLLRDNGHDVYDFHDNGFPWEELDPEWKQWDVRRYRAGLWHPTAEKHFRLDMEALNWADVCVLLLPSGRSAHTEAAWHRGRGKPVIIHMPELYETELMYKLFNAITETDEELVGALKFDMLELEKLHLTDLWCYRC